MKKDKNRLKRDRFVFKLTKEIAIIEKTKEQKKQIVGKTGREGMPE